MTRARGWQPTPAHVRAVVGAVLMCVTAVLARRPDLLVLAAPLVSVAAWGALGRPRAVPTITEQLGHATLTEGQATTRSVMVDDPGGQIDDVAAVFHPTAAFDQLPARGQLVVDLNNDGDDTLGAVIRPTRWGCHRVRPALVVASSRWNAFRHQSEDWSRARDLLTFPGGDGFDAAAPPVRRPGLVGVNRSPREGSGTEFASVRLFQPGDRLRRIHWVQSLRSGELHVTSTWADHDRNVVLVIDAFDEIGRSGGIGGQSSSLDIAVRAAASIAEHHIRIGDRVSVVPMGAALVRRLPAANGRRHLRRILETLARIDPARGLVDTGRMPRGLTSGALVMVLSPLMSKPSLTRALEISDHGFTVVAVDCLPSEPSTDASVDLVANLAERIARLDRETRIRQARARGLAVVEWRGPGSLDSVLRGFGRRQPPGRVG